MLFYCSFVVIAALKGIWKIEILPLDIALLSVLRSHIVGLEERELADIRLAAPDGTIWQALHARAAGEDALALTEGADGELTGERSG